MTVCKTFFTLYQKSFWFLKTLNINCLQSFLKNHVVSNKHPQGGARAQEGQATGAARREREAPQGKGEQRCRGSGQERAAWRRGRPPPARRDAQLAGGRARVRRALEHFKREFSHAG